MGMLLNRDLPIGGELFQPNSQYLAFQLPYSIEATDRETYCVKLLVGDFDVVDVSVTTQGRTLIVCGRRPHNALPKLRRPGIVPSGFHWQFMMPEKLIVSDKSLSNGMLTVFLKRGLTPAAQPSLAPDKPAPMWDLAFSRPQDKTPLCSAVAA